MKIFIAGLWCLFCYVPFHLIWRVDTYKVESDKFGVIYSHRFYPSALASFDTVLAMDKWKSYGESLKLVCYYKNGKTKDILKIDW